jgi:hypothetical protein
MERDFENLQKLDLAHKSSLKRTMRCLTREVIYPIVGVMIWAVAFDRLTRSFTQPANALDIHGTRPYYENEAYLSSFRPEQIANSFDSHPQHNMMDHNEIPSTRLFDSTQQRPVEVAAPTVADIEHLVQDEKFPEPFLSMCQQQELLATALKSKVFRDSLLPMLQDENMLKFMSDFCQKPEITEAVANAAKAMEEHISNIHPLLDDKLFKYNLLSALQEHRQEKASSRNLYTMHQCIEIQKLIAPNSPSDNYDNEYSHESAGRKSGYREGSPPQTPYPKPLDQTVDRAVESFFEQANLRLYGSYVLTATITALSCYIWTSLHRTVHESTTSAKDSAKASKDARKASEDNRLLIGQLKQSIEAIKQHLQTIAKNAQDTKNTANESYKIIKGAWDQAATKALYAAYPTSNVNQLPLKNKEVRMEEEETDEDV